MKTIIMTAMKCALILVLLLGVGCSSLAGKCLKLKIGEGGNLNMTAPKTSWMGTDLGSVTGTGPVDMESCPMVATDPTQ